MSESKPESFPSDKNIWQRENWLLERSVVSSSTVSNAELAVQAVLTLNNLCPIVYVRVCVCTFMYVHGCARMFSVYACLWTNDC